MKKLLIFLAALLPLTLAAQRPVILHSHNDYERTAPFWEAYSQRCGSIEADVFWHEDQLLEFYWISDYKPCVCQVDFVILQRNVTAIKFTAIKFYEEILR